MIHQDHWSTPAVEHEQLLEERIETATALREASRQLDSMIYWHDATHEVVDAEHMTWSRESLAEIRRLLDAAMAAVPGREL